jgi:hypothetical protein
MKPKNISKVLFIYIYLYIYSEPETPSQGHEYGQLDLAPTNADTARP